MAAVAFAQKVREAGGDLDDDWLNNGPSSLTRTLEPGWETRLQPLHQGLALRLSVLDRIDLLCTKLFALRRLGRGV
jgi:hypothetical protein